MRNISPRSRQGDGRRRTDNLTLAQRRKTMRAVRSSGTGIELRVGDALARRGVRVETHQDLPGRPDFILPDLRAALFVHGCFWHGHSCRAEIPVSNREYWEAKLAGNRRRDRRVRRELNRLGWTVAVVWGCQLKANSADATVASALRRATSARSVGQQWLRGDGLPT